jgi:hypothetical protein
MEMVVVLRLLFNAVYLVLQTSSITWMNLLWLSWLFLATSSVHQHGMDS